MRSEKRGKERRKRQRKSQQIGRSKRRAAQVDSEENEPEGDPCLLLDCSTVRRGPNRHRGSPSPGHLKPSLLREGPVIMNLPGEPRATGWELPAVVAIAVFGLVCLLYVLAFLFSLCCGRCGPGPAGGLREENEEATFHPSSPPGAPDLAGGASVPHQAF